MLVCFASLMHILWGVILLINHGGLHITATSTLYSLMGPSTYDARATVYFVSALLPAVIALRPKWTITGLVACLPQLALLVLSGISALVAVTSESYPDGTERSWKFILMDQGIYMILPILYAFETLDRFHDQSLHMAEQSTPVQIFSNVTTEGDKDETGDTGERGHSTQ